MGMLFSIIVAILTLFFPYIMLPINLLLFMFTKGQRKVYAILLSFCLALGAYIWIPDNTMDLYRHHLQMKTFYMMDISGLLDYIKVNFEPIQYFLKFFISKTTNFNLLQFIIIFIGYNELFWLLGKYSKTNDVSVKTFCISSIFVITSLRFLDFASGLWFYLSIINFAVGFYYEHMEQKNKVGIAFYIISVLIHTGSIFLVILYVLSHLIDISKKNIYIKIIIMFAIFFLTGFVLTFLYKNINSSLVRFLFEMYNSYFINGDRFSSLHNGVTLYLSIINLIFSFIILRVSNFVYNKPNNFAYFLIFSIFAILLQATIFVRYTFLVLILLIPYLMHLLEDKKSSKQLKFLIITIILSLISINLYRQYVQITNLNLIANIKEKYALSVFELMR